MAERVGSSIRDTTNGSRSCRRGVGNEVAADISREDGCGSRLARRYHRRLYRAESLDQMLRLSIPSINLTVLERERPEENLEQ